MGDGLRGLGFEVVAAQQGDTGTDVAQVTAQIRCSIAEGDAGPGDRLPPAKDLAAVMGVNTNAVLRALRALRDEGLPELRGGRACASAARPSAER